MLVHEMPRGSPVAMTVKQASNQSAVQCGRECLIFWLRSPFADHKVVLWKALDIQTVLVRRTAAKTDAVRRIRVLQTVAVFSHRVILPIEPRLT